MNFVGTGQTLSGEDFLRAAEAIGCEVEAIKAVTSVEARGQGFDAKRRPIMLFEPHVFCRCLPAGKRAAALSRGLAYPDWRPGNYPPTQDQRYAQLDAAIAIDETAALKAPSWGIGQVLGENHKLCGFATPQDLVAKCLEGEGGQLDVMVAFILGKGLDAPLRRLDWPVFALGYNGKSYAKNQYDIKLARAHRRFKDFTSVAYDPLSDGLLSVGDKGDVVKALQLAIGAHADGDFGRLTEQAVIAWQREHGLTADGKVGKQTGRALGLSFWG